MLVAYLWTFKECLNSLTSRPKNKGPLKNQGRVRVRRTCWIDARLKHWNSNEELVAMVFVEHRIYRSRVSLDSETKPGHFFRAGNLRGRHSAMETNHVCRQA